MNAIAFAFTVVFAIGALGGPTHAIAGALLGDAESFAVLGSSTVTNVPTSTVAGNVGVWSSGGANAITGFNSSPGVAVADPQVTGGQVHAGTAAAQSAQVDLANAIAKFGMLGNGTTLVSPDLSGLTLTPGVYTVHAGTSNLTTLLGALTLDGLGNPNALWVFQMESSLITSTGSSVLVINTGDGAGVFWDVRSSATLGTDTSFAGNILALTSITLDSGATIGCGSALANRGAVTMDANSVAIGCSGDTLAFDAGGNVVDTSTGELVAALVPVPGTLALLGLGLAGMAGLARRRRAPASQRITAGA